MPEKEFSRSASRVRSIGREVSLAAAATLSAERASASLSNASVTEDARVPWPELSDFDCFACHQTLLPRSYRLQTSSGKSPLQVSGGLPLWNAWYTSSIITGDDSPLWEFRLKPSSTSQWIADAKKIATLLRAKSAREALTPPPDPLTSFGTINKALAKPPRDWNAAASIYLDLDAAARDMKAKDTAYGKLLLQRLEQDVAPLLRFHPQTSDTTSRSASPNHFDAELFRTRASTVLSTDRPSP